MGNKWGVIKNNSGKDLLYVLHSKQQDPFKTINTLDPLKRDLTILQSKFFMARKKLFTTTGLERKDENRFFSLADIDSKVLICTIPIKCKQIFRVKITEDMHIINLDQKQANELKQIRLNRTGETGDCADCYHRASYNSSEDNQKMNVYCHFCYLQDMEFYWECNDNAQHIYCEQCTKNVLFQKKFFKEK